MSALSARVSSAVLRAAITRSSLRSTSALSHSTRYVPAKTATNLRTYATKNKKTSSSTLVPGSQIFTTDEAILAEHSKTDGKMKAAVDWYRKEVAGLETRASGRVTPALLSPVRVELPTRQGELIKLEEIATVGVREGSTLLVTVFEEETLKHVEKAIYSAKIPHVVPQKQDSRTIKIPIPKPTVDARAALYTTAQKQAEETRVQLRKMEQASVKKGKYEKRSPELEAFQDLLKKHITEVDTILANMKKTTGAK